MTLQAVRDALLRARERIRPESAWCQVAYALMLDGNRCLSHDDRAIRWCAEGAIRRDGRSATTDAAVAALSEAAVRCHGKTLFVVNDHLGHAAVMRVYDAAIEDVERRMGEK
jgi:hypothetical protein